MKSNHLNNLTPYILDNTHYQIQILFLKIDNMKNRKELVYRCLPVKFDLYLAPVGSVINPNPNGNNGS